jgi:FkbM family methyltransferase
MKSRRRPFLRAWNVSLSRVVARLGNALGTKSLPCHFNGKWIRLSRKSWQILHLAYEENTARALLANLREGNVFLDVGAHFGLWSVYAASIIGKTGNVLAFEPSPAFAVLQENALLNSRIKTFNLGLGAKDGEATFFDQSTATTGSFVDAVTKINECRYPGVAIGRTNVKIRALDSLVAEFCLRPDLIKVDVEGFELEVMRGAENLLRRVRPIVLIEIHPPQLELSGGSDLALMDFLKQRSYEIDVIDRNPNSLYTILAKPIAGQPPRSLAHQG